MQSKRGGTIAKALFLLQQLEFFQNQQGEHNELILF